MPWIAVTHDAGGCFAVFDWARMGWAVTCSECGAESLKPWDVDNKADHLCGMGTAWPPEFLTWQKQTTT